MNAKIDKEIRESVAWLKENNIELIKGGPWFIFQNNKVIGADLIGAVLLKNNLVPEGIGSNLEKLSNPGFTRTACEFLDINFSWLHRFWMGSDRNYQVMIVGDPEKKIKDRKDDISAYAISLTREFFK